MLGRKSYLNNILHTAYPDNPLRQQPRQGDLEPTRGSERVRHLTNLHLCQL